MWGDDVGKRRNDPTADEAMRNMARDNARLKKTLMVARMAIDLCMDDLKRR